MPDKRTAQLKQFESALARFAEALDHVKTDLVRDATIQRFEFTFELAWKSLSELARRNGIKAVSPRKAFRVAMQSDWIEDDPVWLDMLEDRNLAAHTYSEELADALYSRLPKFHQALSKLLDTLERAASE